ncbi:gp53-like domain-containing protein [Escherichia coli]
MHRIDTKTAQKDKFGAGKNGFTRGNPQTGTPATDLDDDYFDMLQEELCSVVEASGASLEKGRHDQLLTALRALLLSRKNPFGDIKSDGTVKTALENLGLGEAAKRDVGTGAGQIPDMSAWSLPSGGVGMPNGIHFRYGYVTVTGDKVFSTPFPNQCFGIVFGQTYLNNEWLFGPAFLENSVNKNGFTFIDMGWSGNSVNSVIKAGERVFYIAIGN